MCGCGQRRERDEERVRPYGNGQGSCLNEPCCPKVCSCEKREERRERREEKCECQREHKCRETLKYKVVEYPREDHFRVPDCKRCCDERSRCLKRVDPWDVPRPPSCRGYRCGNFGTPSARLTGSLGYNYNRRSGREFYDKYHDAGPYSSFV